MNLVRKGCYAPVQQGIRDGTAPVNATDAAGYTALMRHLLKVKDEERQQRREEVLATTEKDFKKFGEVLEVFVIDTQAYIYWCSCSDKTPPNYVFTLCMRCTSRHTDSKKVA